MQRNRQRSHRSGRRSPRSQAAGALLSACISLAIALAFTAPLAHAHLDAAGAVAQGLCGEHLPAGTDAPGDDACSLCLAGGHATAVLERGIPLLETSALSNRAESPPHEADRSIPRSRPGAPRAPPFPA